ncbi:MAG: ABC transporter ATP-binding protein [Anaerolineales bacterium]
MKSLKFIYKFVPKYRGILIVTVISMLLLVGIQLLAPWIVRTMIAAVTSPGMDQATIQEITRLALLALGVYLARGVFQFLRSYLAHVAGWSVVADVRTKVYEHLQRLSLQFYEEKRTGQLMSRVVNDTDLIEHLIAHAIPDVIANSLLLIGVVIVLSLVNWQLALLSLIPVPLIVLAMQGFTKYVQPAFRARQAELGDLNAALNDNLSGVREIKVFAREESQAKRVQVHINRYRDSMLKALRLMATFHPLIAFASSLGTIILIYFGGRFVLGNTLALADLVAFFLYLDLLYQPVQELSRVWESVQQAMAGAERVAELLEEAPQIEEKHNAISLEGRARGAIELKEVGFHYLAGATVLKDINLSIPPGSVVALVGPTGVGKTTLANLIPRLYDVCSGSISIDGHDIRDLQLKNIRDQISIVLQDVFLFHGSVRENILFGREDATEEEMIKAAIIANADEFISRLPQGYDTLIGERGVKLSGGQKQRIAIARAILKDAPILILDEATSSVDVETESLIQRSLEQLIIGKTVIVIAHRLSTVRNADLIVVLQGQRIVEQGTHQELIAHGGLYKRLTAVQFDQAPLWEEDRASWNSILIEE